MTVRADDPIRGLSLPLSPDARVALLECRVAELETLVVSLVDQLRQVANWQGASIMPPGVTMN
jgi:hypothetical protein